MYDITIHIHYFRLKWAHTSFRYIIQNSTFTSFIVVYKAALYTIVYT